MSIWVADGRLYSWNPGDGTNRSLTQTGLFLTGPLAAGDLHGDGRDEVLALTGKSADDARLAVVDGHGGVTTLNVRPAGLAPDQAAQGVQLAEPTLKRATRLAIEPRVKVCDFDGDGKAEIVCADQGQGNRLVVLDAAGNVKRTGPVAPSGALAVADLDGNGRAQVLYLDASGCLRVFSSKPGEVKFTEEVKPLYPSTVAAARLRGDKKCDVVYADSKGLLRSIRPGAASHLLSVGMPSTVAVGPGMTVGDFNGDGLDEVCYLRRRLSFFYPLATLCTVDGQDGFRILRTVIWDHGPYFAPPLGPRASGILCFPSQRASYALSHGTSRESEPMIGLKCPGDSWKQYLSESRLQKAEALLEERKRRNQNLDLMDCLQISDKGQILARNEELRGLTRMQSRRQTEQTIRLLESLRNNLAHSQDIISCDWETIVVLCKDLERVIHGTEEVQQVLGGDGS